VTKKNTKVWTEKERVKAKCAHQFTNLEDLRDYVSAFTRSASYKTHNSGIRFRELLNQQGKLMLCSTHRYLISESDYRCKSKRCLILVKCRRTLVLRDQEDTLAALVMTHMTQRIPTFWQHFCTRIETLYSQEFHADTSNRQDYDYLAIHYHWYNRYAEDVSFL
jgi:hypothetical protein